MSPASSGLLARRHQPAVVYDVTSQVYSLFSSYTLALSLLQFRLSQYQLTSHLQHTSH